MTESQVTDDMVEAAAHADAKWDGLDWSEVSERWQQKTRDRARSVLSAGLAGYTPESRSLTWVAAVLPEEIARQRELGWPDFHPEDFCHRCGRRNPIWWTASEPWKTATAGRAKETGKEGIFCPSCFCDLHEQQTGRRQIWELALDPDGEPQATSGSQEDSGD